MGQVRQTFFQQQFGKSETSSTCCPQDVLRLPAGRQGSLAGPVLGIDATSACKTVSDLFVNLATKKDDQ